MSFPRSVAVLVAVAVFAWALGPWVLLVALALLALPPLRPTHPGRVAGVVGLALVLGLGLMAIPQSGRLSIPPGVGRLVTPSYEGRPATARSIVADEAAQHPFLGLNGRNSMHNDAAATDAYAGLGPLGDRPRVDTAWYGVKECATLMFTQGGDMIGLCGDRTGPVLHLIDPQTMRLTAERRLPPRPETGGSALENICGGAYSYLDNRDRVLVAASDRSIKMFNARLEPERSWPVDEAVSAGDCLIALMPDWEGRVWFASKAGVVGYVLPDSGRVVWRDLEEQVVNSLAADQRGIYVVSERATMLLAAGDGAVREVWRTRYDRGTQHKPGQLSQGSGTTPTLLDNDLLAITDNADPRMQVVFLDRATGRRTCSVPVFEEDASATENSLVSLGDAVIVENNHGYSGPESTVLGRAPSGGVARVESDCTVSWTAEVTAPTSVPKASKAAGLVYVYEKRSSWWGANAWYFTGIDVRNGRVMFRKRTGLGSAFNNHYAAVTLGPDGSAYIATLTGLIRVRDRV